VFLDGQGDVVVVLVVFARSFLSELLPETELQNHHLDVLSAFIQVTIAACFSEGQRYSRRISNRYDTLRLTKKKKKGCTVQNFGRCDVSLGASSPSGTNDKKQELETSLQILLHASFYYIAAGNL